MNDDLKIPALAATAPTRQLVADAPAGAGFGAALDQAMNTPPDPVEQPMARPQGPRSRKGPKGEAHARASGHGRPSGHGKTEATRLALNPSPVADSSGPAVRKGTTLEGAETRRDRTPSAHGRSGTVPGSDELTGGALRAELERVAADEATRPEGSDEPQMMNASGRIDPPAPGAPPTMDTATPGVAAGHRSPESGRAEVRARAGDRTVQLRAPAPAGGGMTITERSDRPDTWHDQQVSDRPNAVRGSSLSNKAVALSGADDIGASATAAEPASAGGTLAPAAERIRPTDEGRNDRSLRTAGDSTAAMHAHAANVQRSQADASPSVNLRAAPVDARVSSRPASAETDVGHASGTEASISIQQRSSLIQSPTGDPGRTATHAERIVGLDKLLPHGSKDDQTVPRTIDDRQPPSVAVGTTPAAHTVVLTSPTESTSLGTSRGDPPAIDGAASRQGIAPAGGPATPTREPSANPSSTHEAGVRHPLERPADGRSDTVLPGMARVYTEATTERSAFTSAKAVLGPPPPQIGPMESLARAAMALQASTGSSDVSGLTVPALTPAAAANPSVALGEGSPRGAQLPTSSALPPRAEWRVTMSGTPRPTDIASAGPDPFSPAARMLESIQSMRQAGGSATADSTMVVPFGSVLASITASGPAQVAVATSVPTTTLVNPWPIDDPAFANHLAAQVGESLIGGLERAEISVSPPEMGPIRIELSLSGDQASVAFAAVMPETRNAIEQSLPLLRSMLAEQGLNLADASVGREHAGSGPQHQAGSQDAGSGGGGRETRGGHERSAGSDERSGVTAGIPPRPAGRAGRGLLDLFA